MRAAKTQTFFKRTALLLSGLALAMFMFLPGVVQASPVGITGDQQVQCGAGTKTASDGTCTCKDDSKYLDETTQPENCIDKSKCSATATTIGGQKVCTDAIHKDTSSDGTCFADSSEVCGSSNPDAAATNGSCGNNCDIVTTYLDPAINMVSGLVGIVVVLSIILGAIQYTTSEGDPQKAAKAKGRITGSIVALIAFFFLYALLQFLIPGGILHP